LNIQGRIIRAKKPPFLNELFFIFFQLNPFTSSSRSFMLSQIAQMLTTICSPHSEQEHPFNDSQQSPNKQSAQFNKIWHPPLDKMKLDLNDWTAKGGDTENRAEAQTRILTAFQNKTTTLDLRHLGLKSLPSCINQLHTMTWLSLSHNELEALPAEIGSLRDLEILEITHNPLKALPPDISKLKNLKKLYAFSNKISELPKEIGNLNKLENLCLIDNQLSTLPTELFQLTSLRSLGLSYNKLSKLPAEIRQLIKLEELFINNNVLTKLPEDLETLKRLKFIDASDTPLQTLPVSIAALPKLSSLRLDNTPKLKTLEAGLQTFWTSKKLQFHCPQFSQRNTIFPTRHTLAERYGNKTFINTPSAENAKED
jgi:Leucine-rich repeat (LRR) protein